MQVPEREVLILRGIERGELPATLDRVRLWGGFGSRRPCHVCAETIEPGHVEYELEVDGRTLVLCVPCYRAWRPGPPAA